MAMHWPELEAKLDRILAQHEALRTTNRELSAKNEELTKDNKILRRRITTLAEKGVAKLGKWHPDGKFKLVKKEEENAA